MSWLPRCALVLAGLALLGAVGRHAALQSLRAELRRTRSAFATLRARVTSPVTFESTPGFELRVPSPDAVWPDDEEVPRKPSVSTRPVRGVDDERTVIAADASIEFFRVPRVADAPGVDGILILDDLALVRLRARVSRGWRSEGEEVDGWQIVHIDSRSVVLHGHPPRVYRWTREVDRR